MGVPGDHIPLPRGQAPEPSLSGPEFPVSPCCSQCTQAGLLPQLGDRVSHSVYIMCLVPASHEGHAKDVAAVAWRARPAGISLGFAGWCFSNPAVSSAFIGGWIFKKDCYSPANQLSSKVIMLDSFHSFTTFQSKESVPPSCPGG